MKKGLVPLEGLTFFSVPADNPVRVLVYRLVCRKEFDYFMTFCIMLSCIEMAMERPSLDLDSMEARVMAYLDYALTAMFGLEVLLKVFAFTFKRYIHVLANQVGAAAARCRPQPMLLLLLHAAAACCCCMLPCRAGWMAAYFYGCVGWMVACCTRGVPWRSVAFHGRSRDLDAATAGFAACESKGDQSMSRTVRV
jgi:hypothetical protein